MFETLADLLSNGFSLRAAMQFIVDVQGPAFVPLKGALVQLQNGASLATALQPYVAVDLDYQILIAELHGELETTLTQAAHLMRTKTQQVQQIRRLLQYPSMLLGLLLGTLVLVHVVVAPNFSGGMVTTARPATGVYLTLGLVSLGLLGGAIAYRLFCLPIRERYRRLTRWPIIGPLVRNYCGYYLTLNAGMLLAGGLGLRGICEVSHQFKAQSLLKQQGAAVEAGLLAGHSLTAIIQADRLLPNELAVLVSKESANEQLSQELIYFATLQYECLTRRLNRLISWIQPAMFVVIALAVLGTYLNLLLPMYQTMGEILK